MSADLVSLDLKSLGDAADRQDTGGKVRDQRQKRLQAEPHDQRDRYDDSDEDQEVDQHNHGPVGTPIAQNRFRW